MLLFWLKFYMIITNNVLWYNTFLIPDLFTLTYFKFISGILKEAVPCYLEIVCQGLVWPLTSGRFDSWPNLPHTCTKYLPAYFMPRTNSGKGVYNRAIKKNISLNEELFIWTISGFTACFQHVKKHLDSSSIFHAQYWLNCILKVPTRIVHMLG